MPVRSLLAFALVLASSLLAVGQTASACECQNRADRDESQRTSKLVFFGEAVSTDDGLGFVVKEAFKGTKKKKKLLVVTDDKCDRGDFQPGKTYMVFADKAKGKRKIKVPQCRATAPTTHAPLTPTIWTLADELTYGTSRKVGNKHKSGRDKLTRTALTKLKSAAGSCEKQVWKGKDAVSAKAEVRFDVQPDGSYAVTVTKYESPSKDDAVAKCLDDKLTGKSFSKFPGAAVSVEAYWMLDRIDATMKREKSSAVVVPIHEAKPERR